MPFVRSRTLLLLVVSAVLQALAFPVAGPLPPSRAAVAWFALVPLLWAVLGTGVSLRRAAALGYANGVLWYLLTCYWVYDTMHIYGGLSPAFALLALLLMCLYLAIYHAVFTTLLALIAKRGTAAALCAVPFAWVAVELARARITSFPWNLLGYAQVDNHLLTPLAPLAGVYGISFVLAAVNAAFAGVLLLPGRRRPAGIALAAAVLAAVFQMAGMATRPAPRRGLQKAVLLQPNLDAGVGQPQPSVESLAASSSNLSWQAAGLDDAPAAVVLWPESPSPFQTDRPAFTEAAHQLSSDLNAPVIAGAVGIETAAAEPRQARVYNSAALFLPDGGTGRYDKIHLVPFGEYMPYANLFRFASGLTQAVGLFDRGVSRQPLVAGGHRYGTFLCYESIFGDEVRSFVGNGADVLVNLSDDGWYGDSSAPFQHLNMARMRAIENRRWLLRDTNTGITASIAPDGRVVETMPRHRRGAAVMHFDSLQGLTFYTRRGDVFAYVCVAVAACAVAAGAIGRRVPQ